MAITHFSRLIGNDFLSFLHRPMVNRGRLYTSWQKIALMLLSAIFILSLSACGSSSSSSYFVFVPEPPDYTKNRTASYSFNCANTSINLDNITDEYYSNQFYLHKMEIKTAWQNQLDLEKCFGHGVTVTVVDTGVERQHEDLSNNIDVSGSYDVISEQRGNMPIPQQGHGTSVAGIIAAEANGIGVVGIAHKSKLQSYNLLKSNTQVNQIIAMQASGDISNNSWGPPDTFPILIARNIAWQRTIDYQVNNGRKGKGTIYVWAAGNGGEKNNNSNYDGYANYRKVIAVGAIDDDRQASFSENGANLLLVAPGENIYTTKLTPGANQSLFCDGIDCRYTPFFNGTSAATPMVSAAIALLLEASPNLGWRDVRKIIARSAQRNDINDSDWHQNGAGLWVNHKYGYGLMDIVSAVNLAKDWRNLGPEKSYYTSAQFTVNNDIEAQQKSVFSLTVPSNTNISQLESVEIIIDTEHGYWADLTIELISPQGTKSILAEAHNCYQQCRLTKGQTLRGWAFSSARLIDENPHGEWKVLIQDNHIDADNGKVDKITLHLYGT